MTRDLDLIRQLLLKLEVLNGPRGAMHILNGDDPAVAIEGYSGDQISYHLELLRDAGFIESPGSQPMDGITFTRLSWAGHDFLDSVRDTKVWHATKERARKAGGFTVEILLGVAKDIIRENLIPIARGALGV